MINIIMKNLTIMGRVLKNLCIRPIRFAKAKLLYLLNIGRYLQKLSRSTVKMLKSLIIKPKEKQDFVDLGSVYVAKIAIAISIFVVIAIFILFNYIFFPFIVSHFFTAHMYDEDKKVSDYNGKVVLYYDKKKQDKEFQGVLTKGKYNKQGELFFKDKFTKYKGEFLDGEYNGNGLLYQDNGILVYDGAFINNIYNGSGKLYLDGKEILYKGDFVKGKYDGTGTLRLSENETYSGDFSKGKMSGKGLLKKDGNLYYNGSFVDNEISGDGLMYFADGKNVKYKGSFNSGLIDGLGYEYFADGKTKYQGNFSQGLYDGNGKLFDDNGNVIYDGNFKGGVYDGAGILYFTQDGTKYDGNFSQGKMNGSGKLYYNNKLYYDGDFSEGQISGNGTVTKDNFTYTGAFSNNTIDFSSILNSKVADLYTSLGSGVKILQGIDGFWLYNGDYGFAIKASYATATSDSKVEEVYYAKQGNETDNLDQNTNNVKFMKTINENPESLPLALLNINGKGLSGHQYPVDGLICSSWIDGGNNLIISKYIIASKTPIGITNTDKSAKSNSSGAIATAPKTGAGSPNEKFFTSVGLDISDFASLGF